MGMTWGRLYAGTRHHRKIRVLRQRRPDSWWIIYPLFEMAFESNDEGLIYLDPDIPYSLEDLSHEIGLPPETIDETLAVMEQLKLIDREDDFIRWISFSDRQFKSDDSKVRVARYRERKKQQLQNSEGNGGVTLHPDDSNAEVTPPEQKQKQNRTETKQKKSIVSKADPDALSPTAVAQLWNEHAPSCLGRNRFPISEKRQKKLRPSINGQDQEYWVELFQDIDLSDYYTGRDGKWTNMDFDWAVLNHERLRQKLDRFKPKKENRAPPVYIPPETPEDLLTPDRKCPTCGGKGIAPNPEGSAQKYRPCECLHPVNEVKNGPSQATASSQ
jgi:N-terminal phage replisome organiser (Phage_rep_org_N)